MVGLSIVKSKSKKKLYKVGHFNISSHLKSVLVADKDKTVPRPLYYYHGKPYRIPNKMVS